MNEMNTATLEFEKKISAKAAKISGSEALLLCLIAEGVDTIFGYPGGAIMPIYDALYKYKDRLTHILTRHEQGAVHAAQGMARVTGKVGVCFATSGPGATNLITGIADAQIDSTPLVCITGQVPSHLLGTDAFQETDVMGISMPITKWNYQVTKAEEIPFALARAFYIASTGRPGPVLIDITKDAQFAEFDFEYQKCERIRSYHPYPELSLDKLKEAAQIINDAKKPFILVGQGVQLSGAEQELIQFAEKTGIPMASTLLGLSAVPTNHPLYVGYLGMHGNYGPNIKTNECDVLIAIGMRFDDRVTGDLKLYARQAKVIHIEIDPSEIDKNVKATVAINTDAKAALKGLISMVDQGNHAAWIAEFHACDVIENDKVIQAETFPDSGEIKMAEVIRRISELTSGEAILVTDVGQHQMVANRYYKFQKTLSCITSGGLGTMGFALPAAMGAKTGRPDRTVIAVIGDGGFQMTIQELGTIRQSNIGVKILILNNNFLGMVRQWQQLFFEKRYSFTELDNPDFQLITQGYRIPTQKVSNREYLDKALEDWLSTDGPALLEVVVEQEENVFPMVPSGASVSDIRLE
ncbi:MAG: biosynthetic-type acetolactate synthase large subunit [Flammeovirgaceae bacterium]|jgi:acetolactate synthase I/II/III large subunit|nr:biosynthetic-type acetolactate synthase large subunit [Flammeovirgaceae bacterium]|tara:strand:- start:5439 stop:7181 length:1743 start_codon:yes stop_codon:yes gene_type:complete